jgi:hypothetical protein
LILFFDFFPNKDSDVPRPFLMQISTQKNSSAQHLCEKALRAKYLSDILYFRALKVAMELWQPFVSFC